MFKDDWSQKQTEIDKFNATSSLQTSASIPTNSVSADHEII